MKRDQLEMLVSLDDLVAKDHPYRRFERVVDLDKLSSPLHALYSDKGRAELGADRNLGRIGRFACWYGAVLARKPVRKVVLGLAKKRRIIPALARFESGLERGG